MFGKVVTEGLIGCSVVDVSNVEFNGVRVCSGGGGVGVRVGLGLGVLGWGKGLGFGVLVGGGGDFHGAVVGGGAGAASFTVTHWIGS